MAKRPQVTVEVVLPELEIAELVADLAPAFAQHLGVAIVPRRP